MSLNPGLIRPWVCIMKLRLPGFIEPYIRDPERLVSQAAHQLAQVTGFVSPATSMFMLKEVELSITSNIIRTTYFI